MKAAALLRQRTAALTKTQRQIAAVMEHNENGEYDVVLNGLYVKERRQIAAVKEAEKQAELFDQLDIDF